MSKWLPHASAGLRVLAYGVALIAVFGPNMTWGIADSIWPGPCKIGGGVGASTGALVGRCLQALFSLCLLALLARTTGAASSPPRQASTVHPPATWSVALVAPIAAALTGAVSNLATVAPWCPAITGAGASPRYHVLLSVVSGFQEEIAFTGIALLLLLGSGWRAQCCAILISTVARWVMHLYYADHANALRWLLWTAVWSGGGLAVAFVIGHLATKADFDRSRFIVVYAALTAASHSLSNLCPLGFFYGAVLGTGYLLMGLKVLHWITRARFPTRDPFVAFAWLASFRNVRVPQSSEEEDDDSRVASPH
ncbi:hypothetical protein [Mycobacterium attenuatum]|uniref:hypothetical protein n=1 Tax=Mycobacterium attenuatum TaxID=2341086 RepID=UPI00145A0293|nr:hypothetical protein [Mycobacterium attenuatum]